MACLLEELNKQNLSSHLDYEKKEARTLDMKVFVKVIDYQTHRTWSRMYGVWLQTSSS